ncbi:hypothetical protein SEA_THERESITA_41 [Microbacterium phage Theresita]|nr:hypothetical protein SEA_THERESITA_41 [Microbacterium phage Theresita]
MNTTPNAVGALSEIDRIGQAALDAIYAEEAAKHPRHKEAMAAFKKDPNSDQEASRSLDRVAEILGTDTEVAIRYAIDTMTTGTDRAQAVQNYIQARRLLTSVGLV